MRWALLAAILLHFVLISVPALFHGEGTLLVPMGDEEQPLIVSLRPQDERKSLIEPGATPTNEPVDPSTDLIAERASKAQDMTAGGDGLTPDAGVVGDGDDLVTRQPTAPAPIAPAAPAAETTAATTLNPEPESATPERDTTDQQKPEPAAEPTKPAERAAVEVAASAESAEASSEQTAPPTPLEAEPKDTVIQLAKAETPPLSQRATGVTQSKVEGGVKSKGFLSFEAMESDFAPYLRTIRDRVERRWKALITMRYTGASATKAVLDCAITPEGTLHAVTVVEPGGSATFAGLCKQAIEQAAPFGPYPFSIPEVYRNQNIEIRWTFTYL